MARATNTTPKSPRTFAPSAHSNKAGRLVNDLEELAETVARLPRVQPSPDPADGFLLALSEAGKADVVA